MNLNHIINMVMRQVTRRATNAGIDKGLDMLARRGKDPADMTDQERREMANSKKSTRQMVKRARKAARITRRIR
ncbi:hypothetical protein [Paracoccus sediminicola]|uniref:hypothetical protein n=1 Tax=Paracoccus sediminicola TaxID=3017783 RepID=UPI0022F134A0|nr:hypothetical protein [Paracoccus sediminicola]WBU57436.1 hypothetical protein PAF18_03045 [Paracoccus sediminicola]